MHKAQCYQETKLPRDKTLGIRPCARKSIKLGSGSLGNSGLATQELHSFGKVPS